MAKICSVCNWENEDTDKFCAMCSTELAGDFIEENDAGIQAKDAMDTNDNLYVQEKTISQTEGVSHGINTKKRYVVNCENSRTKTEVSSLEVTTFYCEGCKEEHHIDGFFWFVQEENIELEEIQNNENIAQAPREERLILEDMATHFEIEITREGGTLGRYGTFGATYLQNDPRGRMVSGEHCRFRYEYGKWSIEHLSRTNDTVYAGMKLEHGFEQGLRNGKIITLANAISFMVRIS